MNVDHILRTFDDFQVEYLLIGGMNFLLHHEPVLTYDIDFWIHDTTENLGRCDAALQHLDAAWGETEQNWRAVAAQPGWLLRQEVFCLTSAYGAIDIFRTVKGLGSWAESNARSRAGRTAGGVPYRGLCDEDMLACQMAAPASRAAASESRGPRTGVGAESAPGRNSDMTTPAIDSSTTAHEELARREHERRERAWTPAARWLAIQETIRWAEAQGKVRRNCPAACIAQERRKR